MCGIIVHKGRGWKEGTERRTEGVWNNSEGRGWKERSGIIVHMGRGWKKEGNSREGESVSRGLTASSAHRSPLKLGRPKSGFRISSTQKENCPKKIMIF